MEPLSSNDEPWSRSHLFTVRVWYEETASGAQAIRAQVRHVLTGETRYFSDWQAVTGYLQCRLDARSPMPGQQEEDCV